MDPFFIIFMIVYGLFKLLMVCAPVLIGLLALCMFASVCR
jgi:hypothetical protein